MLKKFLKIYLIISVVCGVFMLPGIYKKAYHNITHTKPIEVDSTDSYSSSSSSSSSGSHYVQGYTRKDGTYVRGHFRR
jgi:hypothetical protein